MAGQRLIEQGVERRKEILVYVRNYVTERGGGSPSIQEIADAVGLASPNATRAHLHRLAGEGFLSMEPRHARSIVLARPAPDGWSG